MNPPQVLGEQQGPGNTGNVGQDVGNSVKTINPPRTE